MNAASEAQILCPSGYAQAAVTTYKGTLGGGAEVERPRDRLERAQVGQRERSPGSRTHAVSASIMIRSSGARINLMQTANV